MEEIKSLIAQGKTEQALTFLSERIKSVADGDLENSVIALQNKYNVLKRQLMNGTITTTNADIASAKINMAVLTIAGEINDIRPNPDPNPVQHNDHNVSTNVLTLEQVKEMELQEVMSSLKVKMEKRKHFQDEYDISPDAEQKFGLKKKIEKLTEEIEMLKTRLS